MLDTVSKQYDVQEAKTEHARDLAEVGILASDGLIAINWASMVEDSETVLEVGAKRAKREEGTFSYKNAYVVIENNRVAAAIISCPVIKSDNQDDETEIPDIFRPLFLLEQQALGTWNVNILATKEQSRSQGFATALLYKAEKKAALNGYTKISLIVRDENPARQLYKKIGYEEISALPMIKTGTSLQGENWILMIKEIATC